MAIQNLGIPSSIGVINSLGEKFTNMSNPKAPPQSASVQHKGSLHPLRDQYEVIALNRGLSRSGDSPEQVQLDMIYNFKFQEAYIQAQVSNLYKEESNELNLASTDLCKRLCTLAGMVISYSHLVTLWQTALTRKPASELTLADRWLTHRVVIGYEHIDQGKRFSKEDPKDDDLSADSLMKFMHSSGSTGCGLDDFVKGSDRRREKLRFSKRYSAKAQLLFKNFKFQKALLNPITEYMRLVHQDYVEKIRLFGWKLDELLDLKFQPFSDSIETLPLYFESSQWKLVYNGGEEWNRESMKRIVEGIQLARPKVEPTKNLKVEKNTSGSELQPVPSCNSSQKPPQLAKRKKDSIPQSPPQALRFFHPTIDDFPTQAINLYSTPGNELMRRKASNDTLRVLKEKLASGELRHLYLTGEEIGDDDSDASIGLPKKKNRTTPSRLSISEENFISSLHTCISLHLGFHSPFGNDKWCFCPFSDVMNKKWLEVMEFDYHLCHHFCSAAEKFSPGDLISHVKENHKGLLGSGVVMYLQTLYQDAYGTGEFIS